MLPSLSPPPPLLAPSNKAARNFGAKTVHSISAIRAHESLRTTSLRESAIVECDLSDTHMQASDLSDANLRHCTLANQRVTQLLRHCNTSMGMQ